MFGDKILLGHYSVSLDDKCRIIIPTNMNSEKNDILALMYDQELDCYKLYNINMIKQYFELLNDNILNAKSDEELLKAKLEFYKFSKSIIKECSVDTQRRVTLGNCFVPNEQLLLIGANNHVILERIKEKK